MIDTEVFKLECLGCEMFGRVERNEEVARADVKNHIRHTGHRVLMIPCRLYYFGVDEESHG